MCGRYARPLEAVEILAFHDLFDVELVDGPADPFLPVVEFDTDPDATLIEDESLISVGPVS